MNATNPYKAFQHLVEKASGLNIVIDRSGDKPLIWARIKDLRPLVPSHTQNQNELTRHGLAMALEIINSNSRSFPALLTIETDVKGMKERLAMMEAPDASGHSHPFFVVFPASQNRYESALLEAAADIGLSDEPLDQSLYLGETMPPAQFKIYLLNQGYIADILSPWQAASVHAS